MDKIITVQDLMSIVELPNDFDSCRIFRDTGEIFMSDNYKTIVLNCGDKIVKKIQSNFEFNKKWLDIWTE